jgi:hypothetical protein
MSVPIGNTPEGTEFLQRIETPAFRKAFIGDNTKLHTIVYNQIGEVDRALEQSVTTIRALSVDETKTPVAQEEAKKRVADKLVNLIENAHGALKHGIASIDATAAELVKDRFAPKPDKTALYSEIRAWFREMYAKPGGIVAIREAVTTNSDFADAVHNAPYQLLGLPVETMSDMQMASLKVFAPDAWGLMEDSKALAKVAKNYPGVAKSVRSSFYNPALAMRAASRVNA